MFKIMYVDYKIEDGFVNVGVDYEFTEGIVVLKLGEI